MSEGSQTETEGTHDGAATPSGRPTCVCGHGRTHYMVSPLPTYTGWGKFWVIFMGVSTTPVRIDYHCRVCEQTFDFTEDPALLGLHL